MSIIYFIAICALVISQGVVIYILYKRLNYLKNGLQSSKNELKRRSNEIFQLNDELNGLCYSVSHDLKAPLRAINGFARILQKDFSDHLDDEGNEFLSIVYENANKMNDLIDDILTFSRLGQKELECSQVDLNELFNEVFQELMANECKRNIKFRVNTLPVVVGDRVMMRQAVLHLLSNAIKFTRCRPSAIIEVGCKTQDHLANCYIKDNGIGLNMDYANKIFGLFQRLHKPEDYEGNGSGLAIVKRILHRHGGFISVDSKIDQGTTFYFSLPCP